MLSLVSIRKFPRFSIYKISITLLFVSNMSWKESPQSEYKSNENIDIIVNIMFFEITIQDLILMFSIIYSTKKA